MHHHRHALDLGVGYSQILTVFSCILLSSRVLSLGTLRSLVSCLFPILCALAGTSEGCPACWFPEGVLGFSPWGLPVGNSLLIFRMLVVEPCFVDFGIPSCHIIPSSITPSWGAVPSWVAGSWNLAFRQKGAVVCVFSGTHSFHLSAVSSSVLCLQHRWYLC